MAPSMLYIVIRVVRSLERQHLKISKRIKQAKY